MNFLPVPAAGAAGHDWLHERYGDAGVRPGAMLGIRPEELMLAPASSLAADAPLHWAGTVQRVERLGAEAYAEIRVADATVLVRTSADAALNVEQPIILMPELARLRVFDGGTGQALAMRA
jgi:ABC-type sugar transport system ATPase subunit